MQVRHNAPRAASQPMLVPLREDGWILAHLPAVASDGLAALKKGKWRPQGALDLHGAKVAELPGLLRPFVQAAQRQRHQCVLVIFGRGKHSPSGGVLRDATYDLVTSGRINGVCAIASALPADGGLGAAYIWVVNT